MRIFVYGTLMDQEVLEVVLRRSVDVENCVEEAGVEGFRRLFAHGRNYPILVPHHGQVWGQLVHGLSADDIHRLVIFEGWEYHLVPIRVISEAGHFVSAAAFMPDRALRPASQPWHLEVWQRRFKRPFLRQADEEMRRYGNRTMLRRSGLNKVSGLARKEPKMLHGNPPRLGRIFVSDVEER